MVTQWIYLCFPGPDNGKSEGYGLRLVRPDIHGQEIEGEIANAQLLAFSQNGSIQYIWMLTTYCKRWTLNKDLVLV